MSERMALIGELLAKGVYLHSQKKVQGDSKQSTQKETAISK